MFLLLLLLLIWQNYTKMAFGFSAKFSIRQVVTIWSELSSLELSLTKRPLLVLFSLEGWDEGTTTTEVAVVVVVVALFSNDNSPRPLVRSLDGATMTTALLLLLLLLLSLVVTIATHLIEFVPFPAKFDRKLPLLPAVGRNLAVLTLLLNVVVAMPPEDAALAFWTVEGAAMEKS